MGKSSQSDHSLSIAGSYTITSGGEPDGEYLGLGTNVSVMEGLTGGISKHPGNGSLGESNGTTRPSSESPATTEQVQYVNSQSHKLINGHGTPQLDLTVDWDRRKQLRALPRKKDIQLLITVVEVSCKQAV